MLALPRAAAVLARSESAPRKTEWLYKAPVRSLASWAGQIIVSTHGHRNMTCLLAIVLSVIVSA